MSSIDRPTAVIRPAEAVAVSEPEPVSARCKNCSAVLLGRYCVNCSQAADVHVPTTRELFHEVLEGLTHSDSRLWRTLTTLWFKPGKLTLEFVAGRRTAYLPPFRLYLIISIVFFLMVSFMHTQGQVVHFDDGPKSAASGPTALSSTTAGLPADSITSCDNANLGVFAKHPGWNVRFKHACTAVVRDNGDNLLHIAIATSSKAMFISLPLVAFLHMLLYWRPRFRYAEHLVFFVHLFALYFSVAIVSISTIYAAESWPALIPASHGLETVLGWILAIYTVIAMRRVFQRSWAGTLFKAAILAVVYLAVFALTAVGVFGYAVLQL